MGLRFRKSISIIPGINLNFGKTGMSVSAGVPGFRKTFHTSGRTTTSIGVPGTGLSYVTIENRNNKSQWTNAQQTNEYYVEPDVQESKYDDTLDTSQDNLNPAPISQKTITEIHKIADEPIDWTEVLVNENVPDDTYNQELWSYCHNIAKNILSGDIDTYLKVISDINPLNDLLAYGGGFEFGTDSPLKMEVEFQVKSGSLNIDKMSSLYRDYVCSVTIRIARDLFALLPVQNVVVHADDNGKTILSICFDRKTIDTIKFNFINPFDTISKFNNNINNSTTHGFIEVERIEI